ncbi:hypothetical protein LTR22_010142 [Elasticomyces elasticus]|nr:hypothetical protein LTR22_010142 [Elasticomyces elasticus]
MSSLELPAADLARDVLEIRERERVSLFYALAARLQSNEDRLDELERSDMLANALFTTYELLELVLLHLPIHDLLNARAVDKTFLAVIGRSQKLQRSLYLDPENPQGPSNVPPVLNGLFFNRATPQLGHWTLMESGHAANDDGTYDYGLFYELDDDYYSRAKALTLCEGITRPGLWQSMYITRPVFLRHRGDPQDWVASVLLDHAEVTMDDVQSTLQIMYNKTVASANWRDHIDHTHTFTKNKHC